MYIILIYFREVGRESLRLHFGNSLHMFGKRGNCHLANKCNLLVINSL